MHGGPARSSPIVLVMGVAGSGKSTVASLLALRLGVRFVDADGLHPPGNVRKMSTGVPLTDEDRAPWLELVRNEIETALDRDTGLVVACSALKKAYRDRLIGGPVRLVFLHGPKDLLAARMAARRGHFMPPALIESQFATLEPPTDAIELDARLDPHELVDRIVAEL